eukprot:gene4941-21282_t
MADETEEVDIVTVADNAVKNESLPTNDEKSSEIEDEDENIDVIGGIPLNGEERIEDSREPKYSIINAATSSEEMPRSPQPGPSGIRNTVEDDTDEDSDDSVKIIEVPKKSVPLILISDSSSGSEIDVITTVPKKQQRNKKNPFKSIKEKLEEQKSKLFPVDTKSEKDRDKSPNKHDLTCAICLGTYKDRAFLEKCFRILFEWSKVVHTCPLCKTPFQSLIHNITPDLQYHQYFVGDAEKRTLSQSLPTFVTEDLFEVGPRAIYQNGMVIEEVKHPPGRVRYRDTSVEFFQNNPAIAHRLVPWILRDLKVFFRGPPTGPNLSTARKLSCAKEATRAHNAKAKYRHKFNEKYHYLLLIPHHPHNHCHQWSTLLRRHMFTQSHALSLFPARGQWTEDVKQLVLKNNGKLVPVVGDFQFPAMPNSLFYGFKR